jgi:LacI family transcriptional regulator
MNVGTRKKRQSSAKVSLSEVAARANVSQTTASRVLNNVDVPIAPETRRLVRRIAAELGYQPNKSARALATGRTHTIALWTANLKSAYYGEVIYHTNLEIVKHEYELLVNCISTTGYAIDTSRLRSWPVDGILAVDLPRGAIPGLEGSLFGDKPFVNIGAYVITSTDFVRIDFQEQTVEAVLHLASQGCKRIAYLVPDWFDWFEECRDERLTGYRRGVELAGQPAEYIRASDGRTECVAEPLREHIERHGCPDGLFCYNDEMAIGAYPVLRELGLRVPDDVALIGCNGITDTSYLDPPLTTIIQPIEQMCAVAWSFLEKRIQDSSLPLQQAVLAPRLEIRGSSLRSQRPALPQSALPPSSF